MSFVKVMVHAVWGTKRRKSYLNDQIRPIVINHIRENAKIKGIYIDSINGYTDHIHCLFGLNADMSISKVIQLIKGESAYWINKQKLTESKFEWADEYYAASISESLLSNVRAYIIDQENHHRKKTFIQEYEELLEALDVQKSWLKPG